jgi:hypothetical protein
MVGETPGSLTFRLRKASSHSFVNSTSGREPGLKFLFVCAHPTRIEIPALSITGGTSNARALLGRFDQKSSFEPGPGQGMAWWGPITGVGHRTDCPSLRRRQHGPGSSSRHGFRTATTPPPPRRGQKVPISRTHSSSGGVRIQPGFGRHSCALRHMGLRVIGGRTVAGHASHTYGHSYDSRHPAGPRLRNLECPCGKCVRHPHLRSATLADPSFQFTFLAVLGILLLPLPLIRWTLGWVRPAIRHLNDSDLDAHLGPEIADWRVSRRIWCELRGWPLWTVSPWKAALILTEALWVTWGVQVPPASANGGVLSSGLSCNSSPQRCRRNSRGVHHTDGTRFDLPAPSPFILHVLANERHAGSVFLVRRHGGSMARRKPPGALTPNVDLGPLRSCDDRYYVGHPSPVSFQCDHGGIAYFDLDPDGRTGRFRATRTAPSHFDLHRRGSG